MPSQLQAPRPNQSCTKLLLERVQKLVRVLLATIFWEFGTPGGALIRGALRRSAIIPTKCLHLILILLLFSSKLIIYIYISLYSPFQAL
jgi:hypothetical protein